MARSREPFLWALFSSGGMLAALALPALAAVLWIATPLGWVQLERDGLAAVATSLPGRALLLVLVTLSLFHWAHRFRFTLYDGLQLYHLNRLIAIVTYGVATVVTLVAAYVVVTI